MARAPLTALSSIAAVLALTATAGASSTPTVSEGQTVHLGGSDVYCQVIVVSGADYVSCALEQSGVGVVHSYTFALGDKAVVVGQVGSTTTQTMFMEKQPALELASVSPGHAKSGTVTVELGHGVAIGGTHVVLGAADLVKGEPGLFAGISGAGGNPVDGSYVAEISAKRVAVTHWSGGKPTVVFQKLQPKG